MAAFFFGKKIMASIVQSTAPTIKFYSYSNNNCYQSFSKNENGNLQGYSFNQSLSNLSGDFNISIKEDTENYRNDSSFYNKVHTLDIIQISENGDDIDFIGVVIKKSFNAVANGYNRIINISGKSISWLFEYLTISLDATAMAWTNSTYNIEVAEINKKLSSLSNGEPVPIPVKEAVNSYFDIFKDAISSLDNLSNTSILSLIGTYFGTSTNQEVDYKSCFQIENNLKFKYPISSNMLTNGTVNFINYIKNLLPSNIYEIFFAIENNKPKIKIRECPFPYSDNGIMNGSEWKNLRPIFIDKDTLVNYTLTQSIDEVYTIFYSYVEGSSLSPEFHEKLQAIMAGQNAESLKAAKNLEKVKLYGYKPLKCNFIGYNKDSKEDLGTVAKELNEKIASWYDKLDEMYDATITVVRDISKKPANIGERVLFLDGEFYVTGKEHSWRYGQSIQITYHCERGGFYDGNGNFKELKNITKPHGEF